MMPAPFSVAGQRVLVVGAARSGVAAALLLARRGALVTLTDARASLPEADTVALQVASVQLELGQHTEALFTSADLIVTSPGVPTTLAPLAAARAAGVPVIGELELAARWIRGRLIAITGTKGKSTTTALVGHMLEATGHPVLVGGNIGVPLSAQVDASTPETLHVVEASSFQLDSTDTFHPWIAAVLNVSPDHLDRHATFEAYWQAKARITARQTDGDWLVINADSDTSCRMATVSHAQVVRYGRQPSGGTSVFVHDGAIRHRAADGTTQVLVPLHMVQVPGAHQQGNVVAACTVAHLAGASSAGMQRALEHFRGLPHVMEPVGAVQGVRFINDSKATNIEAAARSIESFDAVVAIVGGVFKGGDLRDLALPLAQHGRGVVAIGQSRPQVREALADTVPVDEADTLADAVALAWRRARPDGVVLLAPACASFDMFRDYADRGEQFREEVTRLASAAAGTE
ncbi:MAG: UDP-N-acetylmuramoyl-L-alanine--D-glutamate ligase [Acidobacteria bacterium]|nr:UDP-N-acetylmuramoyl-L-alanine--D-glutamate ligase [Acidobacteriota bacterium]